MLWRSLHVMPMRHTKWQPAAKVARSLARPTRHRAMHAGSAATAAAPAGACRHYLAVCASHADPRPAKVVIVLAPAFCQVDKRKSL